MTKILTLTRVLCLLLVTLLISCSDDDNKNNGNNGNNKDRIVGEWVLVGYTDEEGVYHEDGPTECSSFTVTFSGDGKGKDVDKSCVEGDETQNFQWKASGTNTYTITYSDEVIVFNTNFATDNKVVIKYDDSAYTDTFVRK